MQTFLRVIKTIGIYLLCYIVSVLLLIGFFHTPLFASMHVLMYRGMVLIVLSGLLAAVLMGIFVHITKHANLLNVKDVILLFVGACALNMMLFTLIPVTVERSVSVFTLSYMDENSNQTYTTEQMSSIFEDKYVKEYGAFDKRFDEQVTTGTIKKNEDGTYSITDRGKQTVDMFRLVANLFGTDKRLVYPNEN